MASKTQTQTPTTPSDCSLGLVAASTVTVLAATDLELEDDANGKLSSIPAPLQCTTLECSRQDASFKWHCLSHGPVTARVRVTDSCHRITCQV
jgi:hypothetical protein